MLSVPSVISAFPDRHSTFILCLEYVVSTVVFLLFSTFAICIVLHVACVSGYSSGRRDFLDTRGRKSQYKRTEGDTTMKIRPQWVFLRASCGLRRSTSTLCRRASFTLRVFSFIREILKSPIRDSAVLFDCVRVISLLFFTIKYETCAPFCLSTLLIPTHCIMQFARVLWLKGEFFPACNRRIRAFNEVRTLLRTIVHILDHYQKWRVTSWDPQAGDVVMAKENKENGNSVKEGRLTANRWEVFGSWDERLEYFSKGNACSLHEGNEKLLDP